MKLKVIQEDRYGFWIESNDTIHVPDREWKIETSELSIHIFPIPKCAQ